MSMGGGDGSGKMMKFEKEQIAQAEAKEAERQARLLAGKDAISKAFGAIGDSFYEKYKQAQLGYAMPQKERQFKTAREKLAYALARAGSLKSSVAAKNQADIYEQAANADAVIRSQADAATGQLRSSVNDAKSGAISQLYATEDPGLAANTAANSIRALQGQAPKFDPIADLFQNAAIGAAGYINANSQRAGAGSAGYGSPGSASITRNVG